MGRNIIDKTGEKGINNFGRIPTELYNALYRYEVEITD